MFKHPLLNRRNFLYLGAAGFAGAIALATGKKALLNYQVQKLYNPKRKFEVSTQASLKSRAAAKGLIYGAAGVRDYLVASPNLKASFIRECGILVPDFDLKWDAVRPHPEVFDFSKSDWLAEFARTQGMLFRGHTLVWYTALPKWFDEVVNRQNAEKFLVEHIQTVTKHYAGQMHSWDVVNEAIELDDGRSDGVRKCPWFKFLGPEYLELAYRVAAEADPNAMLVYNENDLEYDDSKTKAKRVAVLKLLERLKNRGTPIHALGVQSHLTGHKQDFNPKSLRQFLADVASLGLKILITELDVIDYRLPKDPNVRDHIIAAIYEDYLSTVLDERSVIAVLTWGLSDSHTWISRFIPRSDRSPVRPLPLDTNQKPKLAWNAIARAFDHAPKRIAK
ncbi:MAG: endo-1,4-beta-xylanase [Scytonema sp. PMC 1069.18]|nr:endo-1,4-beta-xylanase [Scytonema sp. PMC 1069.18]MEC4884680.1 endo-1,4-beta-xylanase [Scytonema sp. PMC 1070.18]